MDIYISMDILMHKKDQGSCIKCIGNILKILLFLLTLPDNDQYCLDTV